MYGVNETEYWIMLGGFFIGLLWLGLTLATCKNYIRARILEILGRGKRTLKRAKDGKAYWGNEKVDMGFLLSPDSHTQIAVDKTVRTNEGDFFIATEGFGLTYDLDIASCVAFLEREGFNNIVQALQKYDDLYFSNEENKKALDEAIKKDTIEGKPLRVKQIRQEARTKLLQMELQWINDWTIPLSVTYKWALQNVDAMNNKNIYDKGRIAVMEGNLQGGWTQDKITFFVSVVLGLLIVGAIAFFIVSQATSNVPHPSGTGVTTTTLAENITRVIRNVSMQ